MILSILLKSESNIWSRFSLQFGNRWWTCSLSHYLIFKTGADLEISSVRKIDRQTVIFMLWQSSSIISNFNYFCVIFGANVCFGWNWRVNFSKIWRVRKTNLGRKWNKIFNFLVAQQSICISIYGIYITMNMQSESCSISFWLGVDFSSFQDEFLFLSRFRAIIRSVNSFEK